MASAGQAAGPGLAGRAHGARASRWVAAAIGAGFLLAGVSAPDRANASPDGERPDRPSSVLVEAGRTHYAQYCASCHGVDARGGGPVAATLRKAPPDLTRLARDNGGRFPAARVTDTIDGRLPLGAHGSREMPVWGERLGDDIGNRETREEVIRGRIWFLVEYLRSVQR